MINPSVSQPSKLAMPVRSRSPAPVCVQVRGLHGHFPVGR
jgi:hypothetical protein